MCESWLCTYQLSAYIGCFYLRRRRRRKRRKIEEEDDDDDFSKSLYLTLTGCFRNATPETQYFSVRSHLTSKEKAVLYFP